MKLTEKVEWLLVNVPETRDSYNKLVNRFLYDLCEWDRILLPCVESITRAYRTVVKNKPELWPTTRIAKVRNSRYEEAVSTRWASIADDRRYA